MPRQQSLKDKKTIYFAYRLGKSGRKYLYSEVHSISAFVSDNGGKSPYSRMGTDENFFINIIIPYNAETQYIDRYTKIWVNEVPLSSNDDADFSITTDVVERNGEILLSCESTAVDHIDLYYEYEGNVVSFMAIDDLDNGLFYTAKNVYLPIDTSTQMWYEEPSNVYDTNNTMRLVEISKERNRIAYTVVLEDNA